MDAMTRNKILTVDDSRMMLRLVKNAIEVVGYEPLQAQNGRVALEILEQHVGEVALVLLDWNMPEMDGYQTLKAIKSDPRHRDIPVMMVTTESEKAKVIEAIRAGAQHYLTKPFAQQDLVTRMMECLGLGTML